MPPNDIHNSTLLTTLTLNNFILDNMMLDTCTSKCRSMSLLIFLVKFHYRTRMKHFAVSEISGRLSLRMALLQMANGKN